ncbi:hypothetical protein BCR35DRAFT_298996 [Leucosporidium creatinivorum]|uniref:Uncharacterized protein n=1 Tax=Leucosporidium creatinivorum TaxID=106004 RepID=A0A1Y2G6T3_9BASI|nr:hypothetical protein BCR35DRAFT_298996 [Leucosporidium creatinivorum]
MGEMDTVMGALESGFERGEKFTSTTTAAAEEGEGEAEEEWDLKASFGHVLWPLYSRPGGMGPVLEGEWGLEELLEWRGREKKGAGARGVWCGSPPSNFLSTTGVLTPTTPTTSPFSALLSPSSPPSPLSEAHRITSTSPVLDNTGFRRLVYLPVELPSAEGEGGRAEKRVEIEFAGGWEVKRRCEVREMKVEVVVPSGASDLQFTLTKRKNLPESAMPDFPTTNSTDPPLHLTINSTPYILSTDYWIRRTIVDVPPPSSEPMEHELVSSATEAKQQILPTKQVQETFHDRSPAHEGSRGIEVSLYLGGTSSLAAPSPSSSPSSDSEEPDSRNLHDLLRSGKWKKMLEALERKACEVRDRQGMPVGKGVEGRVFGAGR